MLRPFGVDQPDADALHTVRQLDGKLRRWLDDLGLLSLVG